MKRHMMFAVLFPGAIVTACSATDVIDHQPSNDQAPSGPDAGPAGTDAPTSIAGPDRDGDGVLDATDRCQRSDDRIDINGNAIPDCVENLLDDGQFATPDDIDPRIVIPSPPYYIGWEASARATFDLAGPDALGSRHSRGLIVTNTVAQLDDNDGEVTTECIEVTPNTAHRVFTRYLIRSGQPGGDADVGVSVSVYAFHDSECATRTSELSGAPSGTTKDAWDIYTLAVPATAIGEAKSMRLGLRVQKGSTPDGVSAVFDDLLVVPSTGSVNDSDRDGVADESDRCARLNDRIDIDGDQDPDCVENLFENGQVPLARLWFPWAGYFDRGAGAADVLLGDDATGSPRSGSLAIASFGPYGPVNAASECVTIQSGTTYELYSRFRIDAPAARLRFVIELFSEDDCRALSGVSPSDFLDARGTWSLFSRTLGANVVGSAHSLRLYIELHNQGDFYREQALLDDLLLVAR
jgi:hypothetical protein